MGRPPRVSAEAVSTQASCTTRTCGIQHIGRVYKVVEERYMEAILDASHLRLGSDACFPEYAGNPDQESAIVIN